MTLEAILKEKKNEQTIVQEIRRQQQQRLSKQREMWIFPKKYLLIVDKHLTKIIFIANLSSIDFPDSLTMLMQHFEQMFYFLNERKLSWYSKKRRNDRISCWGWERGGESWCCVRMIRTLINMPLNLFFVWWWSCSTITNITVIADWRKSGKIQFHSVVVH